MTRSLIAPYGGTLVNLVVDEAQRATLDAHAQTLPTWTLTDRTLCDLELLATGAFSPLTSFMGERDYRSVVNTMRLADTTLWPLPVVLPVDTTVTPGELALTAADGTVLAVMEVQEVFEIDPAHEAQTVFGSTDAKHPAVAALEQQPKHCATGPLRVLRLPQGRDHLEIRRTPQQVRAEIERRGWERVVAFQTRNPLHRAHEELTKRAAQQIDGGLLLHPVVGVTKPGDVDHEVRVRCYRALVENYYREDEVVLSLLPLAMRMGGPREALFHAIVRRNHGCTHLIVGRDHAGPGNDSQGQPFYGPYDAQTLMQEHQEELGVTMVPFQMVVYVPAKDTYVPVDEVAPGEETATISGTQVREDYLAQGKPLPPWFSRPEVAAILAEAYGQPQG